MFISCELSLARPSRSAKVRLLASSASIDKRGTTSAPEQKSIGMIHQIYWVKQVPTPPLAALYASSLQRASEGSPQSHNDNQDHQELSSAYSFAFFSAYSKIPTEFSSLRTDILHNPKLRIGEDHDSPWQEGEVVSLKACPNFAQQCPLGAPDVYSVATARPNIALSIAMHSIREPIVCVCKRPATRQLLFIDNIECIQRSRTSQVLVKARSACVTDI